MSISAIDVAAYIVNNLPLMTTMKMQKLTYYSYVECVLKYDQPLFEDEIQAWVNGPVIPSLFHLHRGRSLAEEDIFSGQRIAEITGEAKVAIDSALAKYAEESPARLSEKTHSELPWINARRGLGKFDPSNRVITFVAIQEWLKHERLAS